MQFTTEGHDITALVNAVFSGGTWVTLVTLAVRLSRWMGNVDTKLDHLWQLHEAEHGGHKHGN